MLIFAICMLIFFLPAAVRAQSGGRDAYAFLLMPSSAKQAAMGSADILPLYNDPLQLSHNPALLDSGLYNQAAALYANYFASIHSANAAMAWNGGRWGGFAASIRALNYGSMAAYNEYGESEGTFSANDFALMGHWAHGFGYYFNIGMSVKMIVSQLENYVSAAAAMDLACRYQTANGYTNIAFVTQNAGAQFKTYYAGSARQRLPLDFRVSASHKFEAAAFGISLTINNLHKWNLYHANDEQDTKFARWSKEFLSHIAVGVGVYPSRRFYIMAGYNYLRGSELQASSQRFGGGLSAGAALRLKYLELSYAWSGYHLAGGGHSVQILLRLDAFRAQRGT
jgi:hypothetical protein